MKITNACYMNKSFLLYPLLIMTFFTGCSAPKQENAQFNAYLPRPLEDYFEDAPPIQPTETKKETDVWDTSDIDISYVQKDRKLISFTFDDGPSKTMENILAVFAEYNERNPDCRATATFFLNGGVILPDDTSLLQTATLLGFELGNHTHSHFDLTSLDKETLQTEIENTDALLEKIDGKSRHLLRPPFGRINGEVKAQLAVPVINWSIDTLDWTGNSEEKIYQSVYTARFSGAIVLMHDGYRATVNALKRLLPDLKADGYQIVSVSALAKAHGCALRNGSEYIRARKQ